MYNAVKLQFVSAQHEAKCLLLYIYLLYKTLIYPKICLFYTYLTVKLSDK